MLYAKDPRVKTTVDEKSIRIEYSWGSKFMSIFGMLLFVLPFSVTIMGQTLASGETRPLNDIIGTFVVLSVFLWTLAYFAFALSFNKTVIIGNPKVLTSRTSPFPVCKSLQIDVANLVQFYVPNKYAIGNSIGAATGTSTVCVLDENHHVKEIAPGLPGFYAAHDIRHSLQEFYNLEDQEIYGITTNH